MKVISRKNLPAKSPIMWSIITLMSWNINGINWWNLSLGLLFNLILWIIYIFELIAEKQVNIFKKQIKRRKENHG